MLDRQLIRDNPEFVRSGSRRKGVEAPVDDFLRIDGEWRQAKHQMDQKKAEMNRISKSIGQLMAEGKKDEGMAAREQATTLKAEIQALEHQERELEAALIECELHFPNLPHESVPDGKTADDNVEIRRWGTPREGGTPHWDIAERLNLIDFERATKISGSGFALFTGQGARLVRSLISFLLDHQTARGYHEVWPPALVNAESLIGTGNLPKFEDDLYRTTDGHYMIPTAEVPVTNMYRDEILDAAQLPINLTAYTPCFRREAGAAGRDTRGIQRMHQFDKVELVKFVHPETSYDELEKMTADAESALQALELPYRVLTLCAGDMGDKGSKTYDLEVWSPGVGNFLEVSSVTNFEAYQARRARIRFRPEGGGSPEPLHILNGSSLGMPRTLSALLETGYDEAANEVRLPEALHRYFGADRIK